MQHWTKIALSTVIVVKNKISFDVTSLSYMISTAIIPTTVHHHYHYHHQQVLILATSLWACSCTPHLPCMHRKQYNQWCYIYSGLLYNQMRTHIVSFPRQQLWQTGFPLCSEPWVKESIGGTVPSIDAFQCAAWKVSTFGIFSKCLGGRWQSAQLQSRTDISLSPHFDPGFTHAGTSAETFAIASQYEWRSLLGYNSFICCISDSMQRDPSSSGHLECFDLSNAKCTCWCTGPCKGIKVKQIWHNRRMYLHTLYDVDYGTIFHWVNTCRAGLLASSLPQSEGVERRHQCHRR